MFKLRICYTLMTDLLQFKINIRKSHRQSQCTFHLLCEDRLLFVGFFNNYCEL
jgi:hypothetical protein